MGLRIVNNIAAMNAHRNLTIADTGLSRSLERLSSGYRINKAADDAAGLSISQSFRADIASLKVASRNTSEAGSLLQVGEGAMDQISNLLTRLKELATQAASANAGNDLDKIDAERSALVTEIDRIGNVTEYAGSKLLDGSFGNKPAEWGDTPGNTYDLDTKYGNEYLYTDNGGVTATANFTFNDSVVDLASATSYTLNTMGAVLSAGVKLEIGATDYYGTVTDGNVLTFASLGMTITYDQALTTTMIAGDEITVTDIGYQGMEVAQTASTGTWNITNAGGSNEITLTNARTGESQAVATTDSVAQTVDFDALGITLSLNTGYEDGDFDSQAFVVSVGGSSSFQVGSANTTNDRIDISLGNATATGLGIGSISFATASGAQGALDTLDTAISSLSVIRGNVGAAQNRLGYAAANLATTIENIQAAESVIRDVDMAAEMTQFTKNQILLQAGTAMLAQANIAPQQVLALFG